MSHRSLPVVQLLLACLALASAPLSAATRVWPAPGPCASGTLQACIDGAATGDTVQIASDTPIDEDITIGRSLTLEPAPGARPEFAARRRVLGSSTEAEFNVTLRGLTMLEAPLRLQSFAVGSGTARLVVEDNVLRGGASPGESRIHVYGGPDVALDYRVRRNRVSQAGVGALAAIGVEAHGASAGRIEFNEVRSVGNSGGSGIRFDGRPGEDFETFIHNNRVIGNFGEGGIVGVLTTSVTAPVADDTLLRIFNNQVSCRADDASYPSGIVVTPGNGHIDLLAINNTTVWCAEGIVVGDLKGASGDRSVDGLLLNNLVAYNTGAGVRVDATFHATLDADRTLIYANASNTFPTSTGTLLVSNPKLRSIESPWPLRGSPAIDTGDASLAQLAFAFADAPQLDANGLRRTIGDSIDIGAFEAGDNVFVRRLAADTGTHVLYLYHPASDGVPSAWPHATKVFNTGGVSGTQNPSPIGTWWTGSEWAIYNQDVAVLREGMGFHAFVPGPDAALGTSKVHVATSASTTEHVTRVSDTFLDTTSDAFMLATPNFSGSGTGYYNTSPYAVGYACLGPPEAGCWVVMHLDGSAIPTTASFNIYAQPPSPNAFVHVATAHNSSGASTYLDHPLLNATPCAAPVFSEKLTGIGGRPMHMIFAGGASGQWSIASQDGSSLVGREFYVLVDPKQVDECLRGLFSDGFE